MVGKEVYLGRDSEIRDLRCRILTYQNVLALDVSMAETFGMQVINTLDGTKHEPPDVSLSPHLFKFLPQHLNQLSLLGVVKKVRDSDGFGLLYVLALFDLDEMF